MRQVGIVAIAFSCIAGSAIAASQPTPNFASGVQIGGQTLARSAFVDATNAANITGTINPSILLGSAPILSNNGSDFPSHPTFRQNLGADLVAAHALADYGTLDRTGATDISGILLAADAAGTSFSIPPGSYRVSTNLTLHYNLVFADGAQLVLDSGVTVASYGSISALPASRIFAGSGTVTLPGQATAVFAEWWGAKADNSTNSAPAFQAAANALTRGGTIQALGGNYKLACANSDALTITTDYVNLKGQGGYGTIFRPATNCSHSLVVVNPANQAGNISDIAFYGDQLGVTPGSGMLWTGLVCAKCGGGTTVRNIISIYARVAFNIPYYEGGVIDNIYALGCYECIIYGGGTQNSNGGQFVSEVTSSNFVIAPAGGSGSAGVILDSGTAELRFYKTLEAGISYAALANATDYGILIRNNSTGGHRPEGIRFDAGNFDANRLADVGVSSGWQIEFHTSLAGITSGGPSILISAATKPTDVEGFWWGEGWVRGGGTDGVLIQSGCSVKLSSNVIAGNSQNTANTYVGVHATANTCGTLELTNNTMGGEIYANVVNSQAYAATFDSGSLTDYTDPATSQVYKGRLLMTGNTMGGNKTGAYLDQSAIAGTNREMINDNLLN